METTMCLAFLLCYNIDEDGSLSDEKEYPLMQVMPTSGGILDVAGF